MKTQLLLIDPQVDFCRPGGALYVKGADEDAGRLAKLITRSLDMFNAIRVTLDSHQPVHIAHPICWVDKHGNHPDPFTLITVEDVAGPNPKWKAFHPAWQQRQAAYVEALKAGSRYVLCIWPPHCLIGTEGHTVMPELSEALRQWQDRFALVDFVPKGGNPHTEHYSVVKAEVPDPEDPSSQLNTRFISRLQTADRMLIAGEALSHCVANSVRDIAAEFGHEHIKKLVLLEDASSAVPGFEAFADDFLKEMTAKGMQTAKTTDF